MEDGWKNQGRGSEKARNSYDRSQSAKLLSWARYARSLKYAHSTFFDVERNKVSSRLEPQVQLKYPVIDDEEPVNSHVRVYLLSLS